MNYKEIKETTCYAVDLSIVSIEELNTLFNKFNVIGANKGEIYNGIYYIPKHNKELIAYLEEHKNK